MSQQALPTSQISIGLFTGDAGETTNLQNKINDPSDTGGTTFIKANAGAGTVAKFNLGTITDPGVDTGFTIRFQHSEGSASGTFNRMKYTVTLMMGATQIEQFVLDLQQSTTFRADDHACLAANIANITSFSTLQLWVQEDQDADGLSNNSARVAFMYLEAPDVSTKKTRKTFGKKTGSRSINHLGN